MIHVTVYLVQNAHMMMMMMIIRACIRKTGLEWFPLLCSSLLLKNEWYHIITSESIWMSLWPHPTRLERYRKISMPHWTRMRSKTREIYCALAYILKQDSQDCCSICTHSGNQTSMLLDPHCIFNMLMIHYTAWQPNPIFDYKPYDGLLEVYYDLWRWTHSWVEVPNTNRSDNAVKKIPLKDDLRGYFLLLHPFFLIPNIKVQHPH